VSLCNREASVIRPSVCLSVRLSVWKLLHASRYFYHKHDSIATKLTHDGPHMGLHPGCAQGQGQAESSHDTDTSVMSRNVCYTVPSDVLSLHALTLWSTVTLSFQYKCQAARCIVYIMEWATPSLTVWLAHSIGMSLCNREASVVRLSVCNLLHATRYLYHTHDSIATKLAHDGPHMVLHPGCAQDQGQGQSTSRDTDTFLITRKSLLLPQTWLDRHQTCIRWSPHRAASRMCSRSRSRSRSKVTWYGHFSDYRKIASSNMTGSPANLHTMVPTWACIQGVLKVKVEVKGHVIRALLWCHEMFAIQ